MITSGVNRNILQLLEQVLTQSFDRYVILRKRNDN